ncbi:MAG TPA: ATP-binding cassette domain-containing protein [Candidatus Saccharimonadales bacterium]|nr:ATP-binding cassette domain-containing protein [Candidatus Saccharimonadales bacterium]
MNETKLQLSGIIDKVKDQDPTSNQHAFVAKGVFKYFDDVKALDGVSLAAEAGKIFALLGPNGAGKTTLVRMLSTLSVPDRGDIKVLGIDAIKDPQKVREVVGLAGQYAAIDEFSTGYENIYMTGRLYHLGHEETKKRTLDLLDRLQLTDAANRPVKNYSGGMRRRLDLGASLIGQPKVLLLDEPTTGLDPATRLNLWEIIRELVREGRSILLTTQYLEEADELADQIAVMNYGKIIAEGTSDSLKAKLGGDVVELELAHADDSAKTIKAVEGIAKRHPTREDGGNNITVPVEHGAKDLLAIVQALNEAKVELAAIALHRPSLDDVFLNLTGRRTESEKAEAAAKGGRS